MPTPRYDQVRTLAETVTTDQATPTGASAGFDSEEWPEAAIYLEAASGSDTCQLQPWYWSGTAWCAGVGEAVQGSVARVLPTLGGRVAVRLTSVSGTWAVRYRRYRAVEA